MQGQLLLLNTLRAPLGERSVHEAGHVRGLSPSVVSRRPAELREWIGDPLMVRAGDETVPTARALAIGAGIRSLGWRAAAQVGGVTALRPLGPQPIAW